MCEDLGQTGIWSLGGDQGVLGPRGDTALCSPGRGQVSTIDCVGNCHLLNDLRIYSSDDGGELFVWKKENDSSDDSILRRVDYGEQRGAIDCIKVIGSKVFLSYDDFGSVAIQDYW